MFHPHHWKYQWVCPDLYFSLFLLSVFPNQLGSSLCWLVHTENFHPQQILEKYMSDLHVFHPTKPCALNCSNSCWRVNVQLHSDFTIVFFGLSPQKNLQTRIKNKPSTIAAFAAYNSASQELSASVVCVLLKFEIYAPFTNMTHELVDFRVERSSPQDEPEKISKLKTDLSFHWSLVTSVHSSASTHRSSASSYVSHFLNNTPPCSAPARYKARCLRADIAFTQG